MSLLNRTFVVCDLCRSVIEEWWKGVAVTGERVDVCKDCEAVLNNASAQGIPVPLQWSLSETVTITEEELVSAIKEFSDE